MFNKDLTNIVNYSMAIMFASSFAEVKKLRESLIDTEASLLSEVSLVNDKIQDCINFTSKTICTEYIDYLIDIVNDINNKTMNNDMIESIITLSNNIGKRVQYCDDSSLSDNLSNTKSKIYSIIRQDIDKSVDLGLVANSKYNECISSSRNRMIEISNISTDLIARIEDVKTLLEACDFCIYYMARELTNVQSYVGILEEKQESILATLTKEYIQWDGGKYNGISTKNNLHL